MMKNYFYFGLILASSLYAQNPESSSATVSSTSVQPSSQPQTIASQSSSSLANPATAANVSSSSVSAPMSSSAASINNASNNPSVKSASGSNSINSSSAGTSSATADNSKSVSSTPSASSSPASGDEGFNVSAGGINVGLINSNGVSVTRLAWRPELSFYKLGVALDLELFLNQGQISSEGWNFSNRENTLNSLYRKIYYIRWDHPGAPFYARAGALDNINMDAGGLITRNYGNTALYPTAKPLGTDVQFNDWTPLGIDLEAFTNSWQEWDQKGGVLGARVAIRPLKTLDIPILSQLKIGGNLVRDYNQMAQVRLQDSVVLINQQTLLAAGVPQSTINNVIDSVQPYQDNTNQKLRQMNNQAQPFSLSGFDARLPIISSSFIDLEWYAAYAWADIRPVDVTTSQATAYVPTGFNLKVGILKASIQDQYLGSHFVAGNFGADYDVQRAIVDSTGGHQSAQSLSDRMWTQNYGRRNGIYGEAVLDLGGFVNAGGNYSDLFQLDNNGQKDDQSYGLKASLGDAIVKLIPHMANASVWYQKNHVGLGINRYGNTDSFFDISSNTTMGYKVGVEAGSGLVISALTTISYLPNSGNNGLTKVINSGIETSMHF